MAKDVAVLVNNEDASLALPIFYLTKADEDAKRNPQALCLGAAIDRGIVGKPAPEISLNAYSFQRLKAHPILKELVRLRRIEFRAPGLLIGT